MVIPSKKLILYMGITGIEFIFLRTTFSGKNQVITKGSISSVDELGLRMVEKGKRIKAYIVLSSKYCYYINLSFPKSAKEKLDNIVKLDLIDKIPYDLAEVYWDYIPIGEEDDNIKVLVCFIPRKDIDEITERIKRLGLNIAGITTSFFCIYLYIQDKGEPEEGIYILNNSKDEVDGIVVTDDKTPKPHPLRHRLLQGGESACQWDLSIKKEDILIDSITKVCLRELKSKELSLVERNIKKDIVILNRFFFYPIPLIAIILISIFIGYRSNAMIEKVLTSNDQVKRLKRDISKYENKLKQVEEKEEIKKRITNFSKQKRKVKDILAELTKIMPNDSYITYFQMRSGRIRIRGEAASALNLVKLLEKSNLFEKCRLISLVTKNRNNGKERFFIEMYLSTTSSKDSSNKSGGSR